MKRSELIAALGWVICAMSVDNKRAEEIFDILKRKKDMKVIHQAYMESWRDNELRDTFFPEL